jgi:hypothetical protein
MHDSVMIWLRIILVAFIVIKCYLHSHIAYRNDVALGGSGGFSFSTFWYFRKPVRSEDEKLKRICNYFQTGNLILLILVIILTVLK